MRLGRLWFKQGQNRWRIAQVRAIPVMLRVRYGRRYRRLWPYRQSLNLLLICSCNLVFDAIFHMNSVLGVLRLVGIVKTSPTLQWCLFLIYSSWKNNHFPSHFTCIWCLVTSSNSLPFVSFDRGLFINSIYTYIDTKTRETSKILIKTYCYKRTIGKWIGGDINIKGGNQYRIMPKTPM